MRKLILITIFILGTTLLFGCQKKQGKIILEPKEVTIEVNQDYDLLDGVKAYDADKKDKTSEVTVDLNGYNRYFVGTYQVTYHYKKIKASRTITVQDTSENDEPMVSNENDSVISMTGYELTKGELYQKMKQLVGLNTLLQMIDNKLYENAVVSTQELEDHYDLLVNQYGLTKLLDMLTQLGIYQGTNETNDAFHNRVLDYLKNSHLNDVALKEQVKQTITQEDIDTFKNEYREDRCLITKQFQSEQGAQTFLDSLGNLNSQELLSTFSEGYVSNTTTNYDFLAGQLSCSYDRSIYRTILDTDLQKLLFDDLQIGEYNTTPFQNNSNYYVFYIISEASPKSSYDEAQFEDAIKEILADNKLTTAYQKQLTLSNRTDHHLKIYDHYLANAYKATDANFSGVSTTDDSTLVASIDGYLVTTDMLYDQMKKGNALQLLMKDLNYYALKTIPLIGLTDAEKQDLETQIIQLTNGYTTNGYFNYFTSGSEYLKNYYKVLTLDDLRNQYALNVFMKRYILGYKVNGKELYPGTNPITDDEINKESFYVTVRHILFSFDNNTKDVAYKKALEVINGNSGDDSYFNFNGLNHTASSQLESTFKLLAGIYSDDHATESQNDGIVIVTPYTTVTPFEDAVKELIKKGVNSYTTEPVETEYGYHVIYLKSIETIPPKPKGYEKLSETELQDIITNHTNDTMENYYRFITPIVNKLNNEHFTQDITNKALTKLRQSLDIRFEDTDLNNQYQALNQIYLR